MVHRTQEPGTLEGPDSSGACVLNVLFPSTSSRDPWSGGRKVRGHEGLRVGAVGPCGKQGV